jgi:hypothetical protein
VRDVFPQPLVGGLLLEVGKDELRPGVRGGGDDAPARRHAIDDLAGLGQVREEVAPGASRVQALERFGSVRSGQRDTRGMLVREEQEPLAHPRRDVVERRVGGEGHALALEPLIEVEDVDVLRASFVRGPGDLSGQLLLADEARHRDELARLDVRPEDGEVGELVGPLFDPGHESNPNGEMTRCD